MRLRSRLGVGRGIGLAEGAARERDIKLKDLRTQGHESKAKRGVSWSRISDKQWTQHNVQQWYACICGGQQQARHNALLLSTSACIISPYRQGLGLGSFKNAGNVQLATTDGGHRSAKEARLD